MEPFAGRVKAAGSTPKASQGISLSSTSACTSAGTLALFCSRTVCVYGCLQRRAAHLESCQHSHPPPKEKGFTCARSSILVSG